MSLLTRAAATLAATAVVLAPSTVGAAHADAPANPPHADPFYSYSGGTPLAKVAPGTVLDHRDVTLSSGAAAEQLLYRTQDEQGRPSVTVTTVVNPAGAAKGVVAYLSYYDGLGDACDPSYALQGGGQGAGTEATVIAGLVSQGYAVTVPDFEGEGLHWVAGHESGWDTLDAVRATESYRGDAPASTKVGLIGYSGGSIAGEWASELAPSYAPRLDLVGAALGGLPVDLAHNLQYIDGSKTWSGVIPAALVSLGRAFGVDFGRYESAYGKKVTQQVSSECIAQFNGAYPGLKIADLLQPAYRDFLHLPAAVKVLNQLIMGTVPGHPTIPLMMEVGNADGTGDGVMVTKDVEALAHEYCSQGVPVRLKVANGEDHSMAGNDFFATPDGGAAYLLGVMAGQKPQNDCATIPVGNDLSPLVAATPSTGHPARVVHARLKGHSKGHKDVLVVTAKGAVGAKVKLFRAGHKKAIGHGRVHRNGKVTIKVKDRNGHARTRYHATVGATSVSKAARTKVLRLR